MKQPAPSRTSHPELDSWSFTEWGQAHKHASEVREAPGERIHWPSYTEVLGPHLRALETALELAGKEDCVTVWAPPGPSEMAGGGGGKGMEEGCRNH